jgi:hypothetical protein
MDADQLEIEAGSIFDNAEDRQVEFAAAVDDEVYDFAVKYSTLEALSGEAPDGDAHSLFIQYTDELKGAALHALSRGTDRPTIIISGGDLEL